MRTAAAGCIPIVCVDVLDTGWVDKTSGTCKEADLIVLDGGPAAAVL